MANTPKKINLKNLTLCSFVTAVMCISSVIQIHLFFTPIPITLQIFTVLAAGILLGGRQAALSMLLYLLLGLAGLPVFSGLQGGPGVVFGPRGGFILGFIVGAFVTGILYDALMRRRLPGWPASSISMAAGILAIYIPGVLQLMAVTGMSLTEALYAGVIPFILPDCFKAFVSCLMVNSVPKYLYQRRSVET